MISVVSRNCLGVGTWPQPFKAEKVEVEVDKVSFDGVFDLTVCMMIVFALKVW